MLISSKRCGLAGTLVSILLFSGCAVPYAAEDFRGQPAAAPVSFSIGAYERKAAPMPVEGKVSGRPVYGPPTPLSGSSTWITPFMMANTRWILGDPDSFSEGGTGARYERENRQLAGEAFRYVPVRWHDALFKDRSTGEEWSLLDHRRGFLSGLWLVSNPADEDSPQQRGGGVDALVVAATITDTDDSGELDSKDAIVAIMTDGDGRNPRIVTPKEGQLHTVRFVPDQQTLLFEIRFDDKGSGEFTKDDPVRIYSIATNGPAGQAEPWTSDGFRETVESRYRR